MTTPGIQRSVGLEVCIASLRGTRVAAEAGAKRIELNSAVELGGLTPSSGLTETVLQAVEPKGSEVIAMLRPRPGGFAYDVDELRVMRRDLTQLLDIGVDGVAFGVLNTKGEIDTNACRSLLEPVHAAGKQAVFHRAFDVTPDPEAALDTLIELGFDRVLTSGHQQDALAGAAQIRLLIEHSNGRIGVLPGGGIRPDNVNELIRQTGCREVHASLRTMSEDRSMAGNPAIRFNSPPAPETSFGDTDADKVTAMVRALGQS